MPIIRTISIGISILPIFSIPLSTPPRTTPAVAARKIKNQIIGSAFPDIKFVKYPSAAASALLPVTKSKKYLHTHPPIAQ